MENIRRYGEPLLQVRLGFPPGTNDVYGYTASANKKTGKVQARSYMRESGTSYKQQVMAALNESCPEFAIPAKKPLYLRLAFLCTPKTYLKRDLDGNLKVLIDALFKEGGGNDRYVMELAVTKERSIEDSVLVVMREIFDGPDAGDENRTADTNRRRSNRKVLSGCVAVEEGEEGQGKGDIPDA